MIYKHSIYDKAAAILNQNKTKAEFEASLVKKDFFLKCPEAENIEKQLQSTSAKIAKTVLSGRNVREALTHLKDINLDLQKDFEEYLVGAGLERNSLEPKYNCVNCEDSGYKNGYMCNCMKELLKKLSFDELNQSTPLQISGFENFTERYFQNFEPKDAKMMKRNFEFCKHYAEIFSNFSENLLFYGATGLGKTHLSLAIAKEVLEKGYTVIYGSVQHYAISIEKERFAEEDTISPLYDCDLLILDDLGVEFSTAYTQSVIYDIINTRIMTDKPTIISTNLDPQELHKRYGERLMSRFFGSYKTLMFSGKDVRKLKNFD